MILVIIEQIATRQQQVNLLSIRIKIIGSASADKYLSNFWRSLDLPLSNCEIELCHGQGIVYYLKYQELLEYANPATDPPIAYALPTKTSSAKFQINKGKLYVPVVNLSIKDNIKFLENIKQGFKRTIS